MAVSFSSCSLYHRFHRHPPLAPALPLSPPAIRPLLATSRNRRVLARGKFEKFDRVDSSAGNPAPSPPDSAQSETPDQERPQESEDDSVLPSDLVDAIRQSSQASAMFISSGGIRATEARIGKRLRIGVMHDGLYFLEDGYSKVGYIVAASESRKSELLLLH